MLHKAALSAVVCLVSFPSGLLAQRSILELLPTREPVLRVGSSVQDSFGGDALIGVDDTPLKAWALRGSAGQSVTVELISEAFDPILHVVGPGLNERLTDDDGAGNCNARITFTLPSGGPYRVVAGALGEAPANGRFLLRVLAAPGPSQSGHCAGGSSALPVEDFDVTGTIEPGRPVQSTLDDSDQQAGDAPAEVYQFTASQPGRVWIGMRSNALDSYLLLFRGEEPVASDDDSGGACNALIEAEVDPGEIYRIFASGIAGNATGSYELTVSETPIASTGGACGGSPAMSTEILDGLDTAGRALRVGQVATGALDGGSGSVAGEMSMQSWQLQGVNGRTVTFQANAPGEDLLLVVWGAGLEPVSDDDGGPGCDPRLRVQFPRQGTFRLAVANVRGLASGLEYGLRADTGDVAVDDTACGGGGGGLPSHVESAIDEAPVRGAVTVGHAVTGRLRRGGVDAWTLSARAGETVTFDLVSEELDAFLAVAGGALQPLGNDDGGGACNARLTVTFPAAGEYRIAASSVDGNGGGYTLRASRQPGPLAEGGCGG